MSNFNPHFREGSDTGNGKGGDSTWISIHTSAKEVTLGGNGTITHMRISIHTSAKEVTLTVTSRLLIWEHFNPHFREGSDTTQKPLPPPAKDFNPHFREGSDMSVSNTVKTDNDFNPHFREGSDPLPLFGSRNHHISIHTSAKEVTCCCFAHWAH